MRLAASTDAAREHQAPEMTSLQVDENFVERYENMIESFFFFWNPLFFTGHSFKYLGRRHPPDANN